jgi:hypothetical protein
VVGRVACAGVRRFRRVGRRRGYRGQVRSDSALKFGHFFVCGGYLLQNFQNRRLDRGRYVS